MDRIEIHFHARALVQGNHQERRGSVLPGGVAPRCCMFLTPFPHRGFCPSDPVAVGAVRRLPRPPMASPEGVPYIPGTAQVW